ncbi:MAG: ribosome small subunit-dependent GTPase A [Clostridiales bacterium]|nr:ribosome small subunit-dependent GTPase A [Clostridiales bacterium]
MRGIVTRGVGGFYYALDADGNTHELRAQAKLRRARVTPMVGDRVEFEPGASGEDGWLKAVLPRENALHRPPVANIDAVVIVVAAAAPSPDLLMADRLLIAARRGGIAPILVVNKRDLNPDAAEEILHQYRGAEVTPFAVSARSGEGVDMLREALVGRVHALAGQSGAGKSTLLNALHGFSLETGDVSRRIERGRHTTRHVSLIPVPGGGMALDTPGFSLFETELLDPVLLKDSYPEFAPHEGKCFFSPCYHDSEPRCAARRAVDEGEIDKNRYGRYRALLEEMKLRWRDRYG